MPLEELLKHIEEEAGKEADKVISEAQMEAKAIMDESGHRTREEIIELAQKETALFKGEMDRQVAHSRMTAQKKLLAARQKLLDQVFEEVLQSLLGLDEDSYRKWLKDRVLEVSETGEETLVLNEGDRGKIGDEWLADLNRTLNEGKKAGQVTMEFTETVFSGGFVLRGPRHEFVLSFREILEGLKGTMQSEVAGVLFRGLTTEIAQEEES
jgi:V/A-type H+-transporting ATPase subunit E